MLLAACLGVVVLWPAGAAGARAGCTTLSVTDAVDKQVSLRAAILLADACPGGGQVNTAVPVTWVLTVPTGSTAHLNSTKGPAVYFTPNITGTYTISAFAVTANGAETASEVIHVDYAKTDVTYPPQSCKALAGGTCGFIAKDPNIVVFGPGRGRVTIVDRKTGKVLYASMPAAHATFPVVKGDPLQFGNLTNKPITVTETSGGTTAPTAGSSSSSPTSTVSTLSGCGAFTSTAGPPFHIDIHIKDPGHGGQSGGVTVSGPAGTATDTFKLDASGIAKAPFTIGRPGAIAVDVFVAPPTGTRQTFAFTMPVTPPVPMEPCPY